MKGKLVLNYKKIKIATMKVVLNAIKKKKLRKRYNLIAVLLCSVAALLTLTQNERRLQDAVNSATGVVFDNLRIRDFHGQRLNYVAGQHEFPPVKTFTDPCQKWGVVTTIFDPTDAIVRVASMPSWCLVIVPDLKTPFDYMDKLKEISRKNMNLDNVYYFSVKEQQEWEGIEGPFGDYVKSTPWKHFSRKNIGYLFAILHGAEYIFDFDDDNYIKLGDEKVPLQVLPEDKDNNGTMVLKDVRVIMQGANAFNHHPIMGAHIDGSWARGFPIERILEKGTRGQVVYETDLPFAAADKEIGVIQFLADNNPDVDALHRITKPLPMNFPFAKAKSVLVPTHAYAPYNAQATIHTKNALWATLLPSTVPGRVSDIWRSYFAQCIFHDAGLQLVFSPPKIFQKRNEHNSLGDFEAEQDLYSKSGKLIEFLSNWDSNDKQNDSVPKRMESLWIDLYEHGYIEVEDVYAAQSWLGALHQAGYEFPELKKRFHNVAVMGQFYGMDKKPTVNDVIFWTQKQREKFDTVVVAGPFSDKQMLALELSSIDAISNHEDKKQKGYFSPLRNFKDVLNRFIDSEKIEGVLYLRDDAMMNVTDLSRGEYPFPTNDIIGTREKELDYTDVREVDDKDFANKFSYRIFADGHLEDFRKTYSFNTFNEMFHDLPLHQWKHYTYDYCGGGQTRVAKDPDSAEYREEEDGSILFSSYAPSDFLFVPTKYGTEFEKAADLFLKHKVSKECALNTIVDMVRQRTGASTRTVPLCAKRVDDKGTDASNDECLNAIKTGHSFTVIHPYEVSDYGYEQYGLMFDRFQ